MSRTLFEQITESPEAFVDWLLAEKEPIMVSATGPDVGIDISISLMPTNLLECDSCADDEAEMEEMECFVNELTDEQLAELKEALLIILSQEV